MPLIEMPDRVPQIHPDAWIAPNATVIGSVVLEEGASVWYGCVLRGDRDILVVGAGSNIQDGSVLHTDPGLELRSGRDVTVGHMVMLHGCQIGDGALIGIGARVLNRAVIGAESIVAAGAVVGEGVVIPPRSLVMGVPGKVRATLDEERAASGRMGAGRYRGFAAEHRAALAKRLGQLET